MRQRNAKDYKGWDLSDVKKKDTNKDTPRYAL